MVIELDHMFYIEANNGDNAYADTPEQAICAFWRLQRDCGTQQASAFIKNLHTGKVVINNAR